MSFAEEPYAERRRMILLAPLMVASYALLFMCMIGLGMAALRGSGGLATIPLGCDVNQQIVKDYLAERVPSYRYRIREWFPATPLDESLTTVADNPSERAMDRGVAQRVKLVFYGPGGARQLDTVYWIQNGRVTRIAEADPGPVAQRL